MVDDFLNIFERDCDILPHWKTSLSLGQWKKLLFDTSNSKLRDILKGRKMLELNRKQELQLIQIGLETLLSKLIPEPTSVPIKKIKKIKKKYKMSAAARKATSERMVKYWANKNKKK
jgi:hypothetical protein